jgi:hypothetical protein
MERIMHYKQKFLIRLSFHLWQINTFGLSVKIIIVNDFKFRFLRYSRNQQTALPSLKYNHNVPTDLSGQAQISSDRHRSVRTGTGLFGHAVQICSFLKRN